MTTTREEAESSAPPPPQVRVGRFSYNTEAGIWDWDDEVFRILGLQPWSITPTTEYMLSCRRPEDRGRVLDVLTRAEADGKPASVSYTLVAADGIERRVLLVCESAEVGPEQDSVRAINGHYIDLTADFRQESEKVAQQAVADSAQHRATIERAVGGLMVGYGLDADRAFDMLRWWSQNKNVKVRDLAGRFVDAASTGATSGLAVREALDVLLHDATTR